MSTKKTPMIALKSVNTLPATMLATERLERSSTGPSWRRRFAASFPLSPPGWVSALTSPLIAKRHGTEVVVAPPRAIRPVIASAEP